MTTLTETGEFEIGVVDSLTEEEFKALTEEEFQSYKRKEHKAIVKQMEQNVISYFEEMTEEEYEDYFNYSIPKKADYKAECRAQIEHREQMTEEKIETMLKSVIVCPLCDCKITLGTSNIHMEEYHSEMVNCKENPNSILVSLEDLMDCE